MARLSAIVEGGAAPAQHAAAAKRADRKVGAAKVIALKERPVKGIPMTEDEVDAAQGTGTLGTF